MIHFCFAYTKSVWKLKIDYFSLRTYFVSLNINRKLTKILSIIQINFRLEKFNIKKYITKSYNEVELKILKIK